MKRAAAQSLLRCRPFHGLNAFITIAVLGLAPQALFCHLLRRFRAQPALRYLFAGIANIDLIGFA